MPVGQLFNRQNLRNFAVKLSALALIVLLTAAGWRITFGGHAGAFGILPALPLFLAAAVIFYFGWVRHWCENAVYRLAGLGEHAASAPIPLGPLRALIVRRDTPGALREIARMRRDCAGNADFVLICMDFYLDVATMPEQAWEAAQRYLRAAKGPRAVRHDEILFRMADLADCSAALRPEVLNILREEIARRPEGGVRRTLERRLASLEAPEQERR